MTPRTALLLPALILPGFMGLAAPALGGSAGEAKRTLNADGTTSMTYSNPVDEFGTVFGLDLSKAAASAAPVPATGASDLAGTAYAKISVQNLPNWMLWQKSTVNLSVSPADATGKVATTFSRTFPVADGIDATLADTYAVAGGSDAWETDKSVSLKLVETGTTFSLATKASQDTPAFLPTLSAQQKLFGDISLTTSLADTGANLNKSITAGFSHRW